jgi:hypothetical protein
MTTTSTATWTLRGITAARANCDHCGRSLARCFRVTSPEGAEMIVGRTCAKRLTGWSWSLAQAERMEALRLREEAAAATYGDLWERVVLAARGPEAYTACPAGEAMILLRDNTSPWLSEAERIAFAEKCLAAN